MMSTVDSIIRDGNPGKCGKQVYTNTAINSKKNGVLRLNNTSYTTATGELAANGRFLIGDITWTPYLWYPKHKISSHRCRIQIHQIPSLINNLDTDMDVPTYTSQSSSICYS